MDKLVKISAQGIRFWCVERNERYFYLRHNLSDLLAMTLVDAKSIVQAANEEFHFNSESEFLAPIDDVQEVWACGVTYLRSRQGRSEESNTADLYHRVYEAERPEVFFKANGSRVVADGEPVGIRRDSGWDAPEPEVGLVANAHQELFGYVIGNDMSSRSIEGENTLYLPQAKCYERACSLSQAVVPAWEVPAAEFPVSMTVTRNGSTVFSGESSSANMKRTFPELIDWLYRTLPFPHGVFVLTGTGIVPDKDFTLQPDDVVSISIGGLGTLVNPVVYVGR